MLIYKPGNDLAYDNIAILGRSFREDTSMLSCGCEQGETNASWVMDGMLEQLLSNTELGVRLRSHFVSATQT